MLKLGSNIASITAQRRLADASEGYSKVMERLSSGMRINRASNDPAGLAIADTLRADSRVFAQGVRNLNDGISLLAIADSTIENLSAITARIMELTEQAANGTYSSAQRKALDAEAQALSKEFFRISRSAEMNGLNLFDGSISGLSFQGGYGALGAITSSLGGKLGTGQFTAQLIPGATGINTAVAGDFNGDGHLDFISGTSTARLFSGNGAGSFTAGGVYALVGASDHMIAADLNNDGHLDLVATAYNQDSVSSLLGNGDGTFRTMTSWAAGINPERIAAGDFNGDGFTDVVVTNTGGSSISVLIGRGDGGFNAPQSYVYGTAVQAAAVGDLNGDGILDLAMSNGPADRVIIQLGAGDGTFKASYSVSVGDQPDGIIMADLNGDGKLDIATANDVSNNVSIVLGNGDGTFQAAVAYAAAAGTRNLSAGDFNGDGIADIATANYDNQSVSILLGSGGGVFGTAANYTVGSDPLFVLPGDFNGDGVQDLYSVNYGAGTMHLLIGGTRDGIAPIVPFSLATLAEARQALPIIQRKHESLALQRGVVGAFQSRLSFGVAHLAATRENYLAAESRIRDADVAQEAAEAVRLQILQQAATGVLAQANQIPGLALKLLSDK